MNLIKTYTLISLSLSVTTIAAVGFSQETHGISMSGAPELPADFTNLPYVNVNATTAGRIVYAEYGSFDSFSPFIVAGKTPWGFKTHIYESFLKRNIDESFALYGLLAQSVEMAEDRTWISFTLNDAAKFSDGSPISMEDVKWSYQILAEKGLPKYARYMSGVTSQEVDGNTITFYLSGEDRELPLLLGLIPIMKKADFEGVEFDAGMKAPTIGSGAYMVESFDMGKSITFKRNPDYWGNDLPINKGQYNLEEIKYVYYQDPDAMFEAFKAGDVNVFVEGDPKRWDSYDFPLYNDGQVVRSEIQHSRPSGMSGFVFNTRRAPFDDWRVREALIQGFNFSFVNETLNEGLYPRIESYFSNSHLGMNNTLAEGKVANLLTPYREVLNEAAINGYSLPMGDISGRDRNAIAEALALLDEAGYGIVDGVMTSSNGEPLVVHVLSKTPETEQIANLWADGLKPLGISVEVEGVDENTFKERIDGFDYDVMRTRWALSLAPGNEQYRYWGSDAAAQEGSRNFMGATNPAIDGMIQAMLTANTTKDYQAAVKALDRVLMSERYVVPFWHTPTIRVIHDARLRFPDHTPKFGYWPGYAPEAMYWEE